jgi:hypothetical protein
MPDGFLDYFKLDKVTGWNWTAFVHPKDVSYIRPQRVCWPVEWRTLLEYLFCSRSI